MELCNPLTNVNDLRLMVRTQYALPKKIAAQMNRKKVCNAFQKCSGSDLPLPPMRYQKVNPTTGVYYPRDTPFSGRDFYSLFSNPKLKELQRLARKLGVFQKDATKSMLFMAITEFLKASGVPEPIQVRLTPNKVKPSNNNNNLKPSNNNNNLKPSNNNNNNLKPSNNNNNNLKPSNNNNNNLKPSNNNNLKPIAKRVGPPIGGPGPKRNNNTQPAPPPPVRRIPLPPTATPRLKDYEELMRKARYGNESFLRSWARLRGFDTNGYGSKSELFNALRRQQRDKLNVEDLRTLAKSLGMKNTSAYKTKSGLERAIYEFKKTSTRGPPVRGPPVRRIPPLPAPKGPSNNNKKVPLPAPKGLSNNNKGPPPPQIVEVTKAIKNKNVSKLRKLENSTNSNVSKTAREARVAVETNNNSKLRRVAEETNKTALRNMRMYASRKGVKNASKYETVETLERAIRNVESPNAKLQETRAAANAARAAKNNKRAAELKEREIKLVAQIEAKKAEANASKAAQAQKNKNKANAVAAKLEEEKMKLAANIERKKAEANAAKAAKNTKLAARLEEEKMKLTARLEEKKAEANAERERRRIRAEKGSGINFSLPNVQIKRAPPEVRQARREKVRSIFRSKVQKIFDEVYPGEEAGNKREANKFVAAIKKNGKNASSVNAIYNEIYGNKAQLEAEGRNVNSIMAKRAEFKRKLLGAVATVAQEAGVPQTEVAQVIASEPSPAEKAATNRINKIFNAVYPGKEAGNDNKAAEFKAKIRNLGNNISENTIEGVFKNVYVRGKNQVNNATKKKRIEFTKFMIDYKKPAAVSTNEISTRLKNLYKSRFGENKNAKNTFITRVKNSNGTKKTIIGIFDDEYGTAENIGIRESGNRKKVSIAIRQRKSFANAAEKYLLNAQKKNANAKTKFELNKINTEAKALADPYIKMNSVKNALKAVINAKTDNNKKAKLQELKEKVKPYKNLKNRGLAQIRTNANRAAKIKELIRPYDENMDGFSDAVPDIYAEYFIEKNVGKPFYNKTGEYERTIQKLKELMKPGPYNYKRVLLAYVMSQRNDYNNTKNNLETFLSKKPGSVLLSTSYIKWLYKKAFKKPEDLYRQLVFLLKNDKTYGEKLGFKKIDINANGKVKLDGQLMPREFFIAKAKLLTKNDKVQNILRELEKVEGVNKGAAAVADIKAKFDLKASFKIAEQLGVITNNNKVKISDIINKSKNSKEIQETMELLDTKIKEKTKNRIKEITPEQRKFVIRKYSTEPEIFEKIVEYVKTAEPNDKLLDEMKAMRASQTKNSDAAKKLDELINIFEQRIKLYKEYGITPNATPLQKLKKLAKVYASVNNPAVIKNEALKAKDNSKNETFKTEITTLIKQAYTSDANAMKNAQTGTTAKQLYRMKQIEETINTLGDAFKKVSNPEIKKLLNNYTNQTELNKVINEDIKNMIKWRNPQEKISEARKLLNGNLDESKKARLRYFLERQGAGSNSKNTIYDKLARLTGTKAKWYQTDKKYRRNNGEELDLKNVLTIARAKVEKREGKYVEIKEILNKLNKGLTIVSTTGVVDALRYASKIKNTSAVVKELREVLTKYNNAANYKNTSKNALVKKIAPAVLNLNTLTPIDKEKILSLLEILESLDTTSDVVTRLRQVLAKYNKAAKAMNTSKNVLVDKIAPEVLKLKSLKKNDEEQIKSLLERFNNLDKTDNSVRNKVKGVINASKRAEKTANQINYISKLKIPTMEQFYPDQKVRKTWGPRYTEILSTYERAKNKRASFTNEEVKNINELHTMLSGIEISNKITISKIEKEMKKILKKAFSKDNSENLNKIKRKHINGINKTVYENQDWYKAYLVLKAKKSGTEKQTEMLKVLKEQFPNNPLLGKIKNLNLRNAISGVSVPAPAPAPAPAPVVQSTTTDYLRNFKNLRNNIGQLRQKNTNTRISAFNAFVGRYDNVNRTRSMVNPEDRKEAEKAKEIYDYLKKYKDVYDGTGLGNFYKIYRNKKEHPVSKFVNTYMQVRVGTYNNIKTARKYAEEAKQFYDNAKEIEKLLKEKTNSTNLSGEPIPFFIASQNQDEQLVKKYYNGNLTFVESKRLIATLKSPQTKSKQNAAKEKQATKNKYARELLLYKIRADTERKKTTTPGYLPLEYKLSEKDEKFRSNNEIQKALKNYKNAKSPVKVEEVQVGFAGAEAVAKNKAVGGYNLQRRRVRARRGRERERERERAAVKVEEAQNTAEEATAGKRKMEVEASERRKKNVESRMKRINNAFGKESTTMFNLNRNSLSKKVKEAAESENKTTNLIGEIKSAKKIKSQFNKNTSQLKRLGPFNIKKWLKKKENEGQPYIKYENQIIEMFESNPSTTPRTNKQAATLEAARIIAQGTRKNAEFFEFGDQKVKSEVERSLIAKKALQDFKGPRQRLPSISSGKLSNDAQRILAARQQFFLKQEALKQKKT